MIPTEQQLKDVKERITAWLKNQVKDEVEKFCSEIQTRLPEFPEIIDLKLK